MVFSRSRRPAAHRRRAFIAEGDRGGIDRVLERIEAPGPKRVLAIDGGGIRGALAIGLLHHVERTLRGRLGKPDLVLADYFDLIGGTSTGSIVSVVLALGASVSELESLFTSLSAGIFRHGIRAPLVQPRFDPNKIREVLERELGRMTLGSAPWRTGFGAVAKRIDTGSPWLLTNSPRSKYWLGDPGETSVVPNRDYEVAKVVRASAAAPFFFDLVPIEIARGQFGVFFDGAISPHVNPALQLAMAAAVPAYGFGWKATAHDLLVVSIGTGLPRPLQPKLVDHRMLALLKAMTALVSLNYDSSHYSTALMQWLGHSPQPWPVNDEVGTLGGSFPREPLWTFLRYDAPLEAKWLAPYLGYEPKAEWLRTMARLDAAQNVSPLLELGRTVGATQVKGAHFAPCFDIGVASHAELTHTSP